ncbi:hypothetical protein DK867_07180 [Ochrobactrum sp. POC9]|nr:hypothetical protein DK867_07180 [Ochrobactrum sp. POC9]
MLFRIVPRKTASHFCWKCCFFRIVQRKTASHFCWKCSYENYFLIQCLIFPVHSISLYGIFHSIKSNDRCYDTGTATNFH